MERIPPNGEYRVAVYYCPFDGGLVFFGHPPPNRPPFSQTRRGLNLFLATDGGPKPPAHWPCVEMILAWPEYPWRVDSARIVPDPSWVDLLQRWLPDYYPRQLPWPSDPNEDVWVFGPDSDVWWRDEYRKPNGLPKEPDWGAVRRILLKAPFNFTPKDLDAFKVDDVFTYLEQHADLAPLAAKTDKTGEGEVSGGDRAVAPSDCLLVGPRMTKVFISYAHSSPEHIQTVSRLVETLRANGLIVTVDTDVKTPQGPEEGWPRWMKQQIKEEDWVLMFFDELYRRRFDGRRSLIGALAPRGRAQSSRITSTATPAGTRSSSHSWLMEPAPL